LCCVCQVRVAKGQPQIFVPVGRGIAGTCAQICEPILVPDAYADPRFDRSHDARTGFRTRNIIAVPITALEDGTTVVGVLQCINKHKDAAFNDADIFILQTLGAQACVTLRNAMLVDVAFAERRKSRALLDIVHSLNLSNGNANVSSVSSQIFTVIQRTTDMVDSDRTTFFLVDHAKQELWSMQGSINLRFPMSKGLAGSVACSGEKINIADAYEDPRFNRETDKRTGYRTRSVLVLPMFGTRSSTSEASTEGEVRSIAEEEDAVEVKRPIIGVLQVINKKDGTPFDESDEEVLRMFLDITGPILEKSMLYQQLNKPAPAKEAARAFGGTTTTTVTTPRRRSNPTSNNTFAEDEENEEED
jgi:adenylate cyclase